MVSIASWRRRGGSAHLEKRLSSLQDDLGRLQRDLRGLAAAGGEIAGERVADAFEGAGERARAVADRATERIAELTNGNLDPVRDQVRSQPLTTVFLSIGAGALIGALLAAPIASRRD